MEIEKLLKIKTETEIEKLVLILGNNVDYYGSKEGVMISTKRFDKCAAEIMMWHEQQIKNISNEKLQSPH